MTQKFKPGDRVTVRSGGTVYVIESIDGFACMIRQEGTVDGYRYALQRFDTSLLTAVSR